jgi:hypothetical protein
MKISIKSYIYFFLIGCLFPLNVSAQIQCDNEGNVWDKSWVSCSKTANPNPARANSHWLLFEFDIAESISTTKLWNANRPGESTRGVRDMYVDYSIDGTNWVSLGTFRVNRTTESQYYVGTDGPDFGGIFVKKILFTVQTTYGDPNCASLSEVQFNIDETACYGTLDECNVCDGPGKTFWFRDNDNDGLGDPLSARYACNPPTGFVGNKDDLCDTGILGWADIGPLFENNGCTGCHGSNGSSGGLDLTSYDAFAQGGNKCSTNLLTGSTLVNIISIDGYDGCSAPISPPSMNTRVGDQVDDAELATLQAWIDSGAPEFCQCPPSAPDSDNDGVCDNMDTCPGFDNALIGTSCDDGIACTVDDVIDIFCNCTGMPAQDSDDDGVCDALDVSPNNPCTADGTVDGIEPSDWTGSVNNDCDQDGIVLGQGDIDDFSECIDQYGLKQNADCVCGDLKRVGGGKYAGHTGVGLFPSMAEGVPDGANSGYIGFLDRLLLTYPALPLGTEICFTLGFDNVNGVAGIELNDIGTYTFENTLDSINFFMQEFCITTIEPGPQTIAILDLGGGGVRVDGSEYEYCPCTSTDQDEFSPDCQCPGNQVTETASFVSEVGFTNGINAEGEADGVFTGVLGYQDTLTLQYPNMAANTKICVTAGFNNAGGVLEMIQSGSVYTFRNESNAEGYASQEYCFVTSGIITDNLLQFTDVGAGAIQIDGTRTVACDSCSLNDPDSDGDGICDANDPCPNSATNDSDYDGICDDMDICIGFDDTYDTDGDGVPNGCDVCTGFNDAADSDNDGVPNGCDTCPGGDDSVDSDNDGIPDACDTNPCENFVLELTTPVIASSKKVAIQIQTNGTVYSPESIFYKAGQEINLMREFEVKRGATFLAEIENCN